MKNILYLISKKKFDIVTGNYLKNYANIIFMASDPMDWLFCKANGEDCVAAYRYLKKTPDINIVQSDKENLLARIEQFRLSRSQKECLDIANLFKSYTDFLTDFIQKERIDICITRDRETIDSVALEEAANKTRSQIFFLSSGRFRGETIGLATERFNFTNYKLWEQKLVEFNKKEFDKCGNNKLPFHEKNKINIRTPSKIWEFITLLQYNWNPKYRKNLRLLRPRRPFLTGTQHRLKKKRAQKLPPDHIALPELFILLPLQGNEILHQVKNPFHVQDMQHLTGIVIDAVTVMNRCFKTNFKLIVKEHPSRPFVISKEFERENPEVIFLKKYDMNKLLDATSLLVTFNSLAGFEALLKNKPVVMLGPLFYCIPGLVHRPKNLDELPDVMHTALSNPPDEIILNKLVCYLKNVYEVKANRKNLDSHGLYNIACKIFS